MNGRIVLATPHERHAALARRLEARGVALTWVRTREELTPEALAGFAPDYVFFPHWSWKIPAGIFEQFDAVIFHMTDVPFGRGGSPLQNLIRRGIEATQLTALRCVAEMDAGPVYLKRPLSLLGTAEEIFLRAAELMEDMIVEILVNRPVPVPQQGEPVIFKRLRPADGDLREVRTLKEMFDRIRMLDATGYPPAFVNLGPFTLEFSRASLRPNEVVADVRIVCRGGDGR